MTKWISIGLGLLVLLLVGFALVANLDQGETPDADTDALPGPITPSSVTRINYPDDEQLVNPESALANQGSSIGRVPDLANVTSHKTPGFIHNDSNVEEFYSDNGSVSGLPPRQNAFPATSPIPASSSTANGPSRSPPLGVPLITQPVTGDGPLGSGPPQTDSGLPGPGEILGNTVISGSGPAQINQHLPSPDPSASGQNGSMIWETDLTLPGPGQARDDLDVVGPGEESGGSL